MSTYRLETLFAPKSVAVIGASPREKSVGRAIVKNLRAANFPGPLHVVNPRYDHIEGVATAKSIEALERGPDLVIIATPPESIPDLVARCAARGVGSAIIITAGLGQGASSLAAQAEQAARAHGMRLLGPNCLGLIAPHAKLNASFASRMVAPGDLALISQSGAVGAGLVEWAARRGVGFSAMASLGDSADIDFGDLLDYFALDRRTRGILLYIESIKDARKFMSAARAAARAKPVLVVKSGRHAQGAKAAATHTGALAGSDAVYDAAFRRAGLLRVFDLDEVFAAAETLGRLAPFAGRRLAILTNGGGLGVLAVDRLIDFGGTLAGVSADTIAQLDLVLPKAWSRSNPVDIIGDADATRYRQALEALLDDKANDAILIINVPTAMASPRETARAVADTYRQHKTRVFPLKPVFAVWVGDDGSASSEFDGLAIPHYATEVDAVRGFMHLVHYREAQTALMETPPSVAAELVADVASAKAIVANAISAGQTWLDPMAVTALFEAYGIPITPARLARNPDEAVAVAAPFLNAGIPVALKILSPDIVHKSDVGGVRLNITNENGVREAADDILRRARTIRPDARITGLTVHPMITRPKARELIAGLADDDTFGPVIVFGRGGTAVEVINDKALALPPLDLRLAHELISRTRVSRILKAYRDVPAADENAVALVLVKLAQLAADLPEISELDINPLLADASGIIAVDARVAIKPLARLHKGPFHPRFAVRPYPSEWEMRAALPDGQKVFLRPVRPEDEEMFRVFFQKVTPEDLRLRFFAPVKDFSHTFIARLTQLDYAREIALVAIDEANGEMLGAVRLHADANFHAGEYAILVRSDLKGQGLGWLLMSRMIEYARWLGLQQVEGQVLVQNRTMLEMCRDLGFSISPDPQDSNVVTVTLPL